MYKKWRGKKAKHTVCDDTASLSEGKPLRLKNGREHNCKHLQGIKKR